MAFPPRPFIPVLHLRLRRGPGFFGNRRRHGRDLRNRRQRALGRRRRGCGGRRGWLGNRLRHWHSQRNRRQRTLGRRRRGYGRRWGWLGPRRHGRDLWNRRQRGLRRRRSGHGCWRGRGGDRRRHDFWNRRRRGLGRRWGSRGRRRGWLSDRRRRGRSLRNRRHRGLRRRWGGRGRRRLRRRQRVRRPRDRLRRQEHHRDRRCLLRHAQQGLVRERDQPDSNQPVENHGQNQCPAGKVRPCRACGQPRPPELRVDVHAGSVPMLSPARAGERSGAAQSARSMNPAPRML